MAWAQNCVEATGSIEVRACTATAPGRRRRLLLQAAPSPCQQGDWAGLGGRQDTGTGPTVQPPIAAFLTRPRRGGGGDIRFHFSMLSIPSRLFFGKTLLTSSTNPVLSSDTEDYCFAPEWACYLFRVHSYCSLLRKSSPPPFGHLHSQFAISPRDSTTRALQSLPTAILSLHPLKHPFCQTPQPTNHSASHTQPQAWRPSHPAPPGPPSGPPTADLPPSTPSLHQTPFYAPAFALMVSVSDECRGQEG